MIWLNFSNSAVAGLPNRTDGPTLTLHQPIMELRDSTNNTESAWAAMYCFAAGVMVISSFAISTHLLVAKHS